VVGLAIFIGPRDYKIAYTYNMELDEKGCYPGNAEV